MPFWHLLYSWTIISFRQEILIHVLIPPLFLPGSHFLFYKIKESSWILFEAWSSSKIWLYSKRFKRKKKYPPQQIATISLQSFRLNQSLINVPFPMNTLCPGSINIITWWFQRIHKFHRRSRDSQLHIRIQAGCVENMDLTMRSLVFLIAHIKWTITETPYSFLFLNLHTTAAENKCGLCHGFLERKQLTSTSLSSPVFYKAVL